MATEYSFTITNMLCQQTVLGRPDFVSQINLTLTCVDPDLLSINVKGSISLDPGLSFTPFSELTEAQVNAWVEESPEYEKLKEIGDKALLDLRYPPVVVKQPPWISSTVTNTATVVTTSTNVGS